MSAFCLAGPLSAPSELDSACRMERPGSAAPAPPPSTAGQETGGPAALLPAAASPSVGGELELALEEELALLASAGEGPREAEAQDPLALPPAEPELLSLMRQKEKDLVLAARLGKALLERNQDLSRQYERMYKELTEKLEHLEQEKHELRRRFENKEGEWEGRVSELESDVKQLQDELEKQQVHLREADREKTRAVQELSEQNQRLLDQLSKVRESLRLRGGERKAAVDAVGSLAGVEASEAERKLSTQVHVLQEDFREKRSSTNQHIVRLESLQAEIKMLRDRKQDLERRLSAMVEENNLLQGTVEELQDRVIILERQSHEKDTQLHQSQMELQEVRLSYRQLQVKMEELNEERSLQDFNSTRMSLLSEIEQSMEAEELEQEREQLRLQLWEAYCQVRYLCTHLRGNDSADSAVSTDSSMDESSETSSAKDVPAGSLRAALSELKRLIQSVIDGTDCPGSRRSDDDALEEQIKQTSEDSRALREKNAVEMELAKCRMDMMSLNSQLLDAIQQKLNLSQQLEAWQDDMQRLIDQQLMDRHPKEWSQIMTCNFTSSSSHGAKHRARPSPLLRLQQQGSELVGAEGNRLFSFFKKN
ncbi:hypothetical protein Chor_013028 [Crotalus horridus]